MIVLISRSLAQADCVHLRSVNETGGICIDDKLVDKSLLLNIHAPNLSATCRPSLRGQGGVIETEARNASQLILSICSQAILL
jgi:hypothetical protein